MRNKGDDNECYEANANFASPPTQPHATSAGEIVEGTKAWLDVAKSFVFVEVSSLVLLFSCVAIWGDYSKQYTAYALSVAVVSLSACLIIQTGEFIRPGFLEKFEKPVSLFLLLWWGIGTGLITFKSPFLVTSNGWFSAWAGFLSTLSWALNMDSSMFKDMERGRQILVVLLACSIIEICACIDPIRFNSYRSQASWGLSGGCITAVSTTILFKAYDDVKLVIMKIVAFFLFIIWVLVAGICTFDGPFRFTGNGYFASWVGFITSIMFGLHQMSREDELL